MTGQVYGRLVVTADYSLSKRSDGKGSRSKWLCRCECGTKVWVLRDLLLNGNTRSCGCLLADIRKSNYGKARKNDLYHTYRYNASIKGLAFDLSKKTFHELTQNNCYYCNQAPSQTLKSRSGNGDYIYNGIDRKNNKEGYTKNNSVACCKRCNYAKGNLSVKEFLEHVGRVYYQMRCREVECGI